MYFEDIEQNRTKLWIINSLLELIEQKEYSSITINMIVEHAQLGRRTFYRHFKTKDDVVKYVIDILMEQFAKTILKNNFYGMANVLVSYFEFWENYVDILLLMKKAHLLHFIEDNLTELIVNVAKRVQHVPNDISAEQMSEFYEQYKYEFSVKLAGIWKATTLWCEESPRKSPEEMSKIITSFLS